MRRRVPYHQVGAGKYRAIRSQESQQRGQVGQPVMSAWNGMGMSRTFTRVAGTSNFTALNIHPRPLMLLLVCGPSFPPTSLGDMGWMEESNPFIQRLIYRIDTHPDQFRLQGARRIRGFDCVGFRHTQRSAADGGFATDVFWVTPSAGCTPMEYTYEWGRENKHWRSVSHVLDLREVAPGRWMPFLCGTVDGIVVRGTKPRRGPRATLIEVVEFEWGYGPSPDELTVALDGEVEVRFGVRPLLRLDRLQLAPRDLPALAARFGPPPAAPPPARSPYLVLGAGVVLFLLAVVGVSYFARRLRGAGPEDPGGGRA